jgi:uncharacterized protein (TIGR03067 family)
MKSSKALLLCGAALVIPWAVNALGQDEITVQAEMEMLQGVWQLTKWIGTDGTLVPAEEVNGSSFDFKEDRMIKRGKDEKNEKDFPPPSFKFLLNASKKPKWIDFDFGFPSEVQFQGIYKLEGDELTICMITASRSDQAPERPTEFKSNNEKYHSMFVLKKATK